LTNHGNINGRKLVAQILEAGLTAADPYEKTKMLVRLDNGKLIVGHPCFQPFGDPHAVEEIYNLNEIDRIYVFGAGKGVQYIAKALEDIFGDLISGGHVIDKKGCQIILKRIEVTLGGHPLPDEDCIKGSKRILSLSRGLTERDLVFTITANGVSALLTLPVPEVSLEDIRAVTSIMQIKYGVPTSDLNSVRNHLDMMKGGQISRNLYPARMVHILAIPPKKYNDFLHNNFWLHTLPDCTTLQDAIRILKKWQAWEEVPRSVTYYLEKVNPEKETPKAKEFAGMVFRIFAIMPDDLSMLESSKRKAEELGLKTVTLIKGLQAEAKEAGSIVAYIANNIEIENEPVQTPCALFTTGELLVTVGSKMGVGGRNQEFVLAAALKISGSKQIAIGAVDSDGTDGPGTQLILDSKNIPCLAGGIVDGETLKEAKELGLDLEEHLINHNATPALWKLNCGIVATPNISIDDLSVTIILDNEKN